MKTIKNRKTPITYYGGKQRMLGHILPLIPEHVLYVEAFIGGAAVFFAKPESKSEVINDLRGDVVNFYRICQGEFGVLRKLIHETPYSRQVYRESEMVLKNADCYSSVKQAWAFWVQTNTSFGSQMFSSWGFEKSEGKRPMSLYRKRMAFTKFLMERLHGVQIEQDDALKVIKRFDTPDTFFYLDPPYFQADMGHYGGYSEQDFTDLLTLLGQIKGKFLLSSYPGELLEAHTEANGWHVKRIGGKVSTNLLKVKKDKIEVLTANYAI